MIARILLRTDNRYPTARERAELSAYAATARARRAALQEVRSAAPRIVDDLISALKPMYPQFAAIRPQGFDKGHRDMVLVTHMAANAMFLGETETLDETFTVWYRSILKAVHVSPQFLVDSFALWRSALERHLSPDTYALLRPYTDHLASALADIPVPAQDETGQRRLAE